MGENRGITAEMIVIIQQTCCFSQVPLLLILAKVISLHGEVIVITPIQNHKLYEYCKFIKRIIVTEELLSITPEQKKLILTSCQASHFLSLSENCSIIDTIIEIGIKTRINACSNHYDDRFNRTILASGDNERIRSILTSLNITNYDHHTHPYIYLPPVINPPRCQIILAPNKKHYHIHQKIEQTLGHIYQIVWLGDYIHQHQPPTKIISSHISSLRLVDMARKSLAFITSKSELIHLSQLTFINTILINQHNTQPNEYFDTIRLITKKLNTWKNTWNTR